MNFYDTIAAVSTPAGKGGVALIRISGAEAIAVADRIFESKSKKPLSETESNFAAYGDIFGISEKGERVKIDDGLATVFRAPRSFTGEDTVEICCHGGILVTRAVLASALAHGARAAEAGEFTRRAFVNGKMGLSRAEALGSLLDARTEQQMILSRSGLDGKVESRTRMIYDELCALVSSTYAKIDFPDEDLGDFSPEETRAKVAKIRADVLTLLGSYGTGRAIAEGIKTVICGKTNAGKSSLYNRIVGRDAAIVTDVEGTTRDLIEETASLGGVTIRLYDTAGLRDTTDKVEQIGVERARREIEDAELILAVFDRSRPLSTDDTSLIDTLSHSSAAKIAVLNKIDAPEAIEREKITEVFSDIVEISAKEGDGIDALASKVSSLFLDGALDIRNDPIVASARQHASLTSALAHIDSALAALDMNLSEDVSCVDLELAMSSLAEIDGREVSEDIVSSIFSHFCVGK